MPLHPKLLGYVDLLNRVDVYRGFVSVTHDHNVLIYPLRRLQQAVDYAVGYGARNHGMGVLLGNLNRLLHGREC